MTAFRATGSETPATRRPRLRPLIAETGKRVVHVLERIRRGVVQRGGVRRVGRQVGRKAVGVREEDLALLRCVCAVVVARLRAERPAAVTAEEGVHVARHDEDVARVRLGLLQAGEGRVDLAERDGVLVRKVVRGQRSAEAAIGAVVRVALALGIGEGQVARVVAGEARRVLEDGRLEECGEEAERRSKQVVSVSSRDSVSSCFPSQTETRAHPVRTRASKSLG